MLAPFTSRREHGPRSGAARPGTANIFTQAVANIMPGEQVTVTISYLQVLQYEAGSYEFVFPMVVGPRYIPGKPVGQQGAGWSADTNKVPDASRITPPVAVPGTRAGHDIAMNFPSMRECRSRNCTPGRTKLTSTSPRVTLQRSSCVMRQPSQPGLHPAISGGGQADQ